MAKGETQFVGIIPSGKDQVFIQLAANADIDTKLVAADGHVMIMYTGTNTWAGGCVTCPEATNFTYDGMDVKSCVDKCEEDLTLTVRRSEFEERGLEQLRMPPSSAFS